MCNGRGKGVESVHEGWGCKAPQGDAPGSAKSTREDPSVACVAAEVPHYPSPGSRLRPSPIVFAMDPATTSASGPSGPSASSYGQSCGEGEGERASNDRAFRKHWWNAQTTFLLRILRGTSRNSQPVLLALRSLPVPELLRQKEVRRMFPICRWTCFIRPREPAGPTCRGPRPAPPLLLARTLRWTRCCTGDRHAGGVIQWH